MNIIKRRSIFIFIMLCLIGTLVSCSNGKDYYESNLNIPFQYAVYCNQSVYYNPDGSKIVCNNNEEDWIVFDISNQKDGNNKIKSVSGITAYGDTIYFLYSIEGVYTSETRIGRIKYDGTDLKLDCVGDIRERESIRLVNEVGYIRVIDNIIIVSGDAFASGTAVFDLINNTGVCYSHGLRFFDCYNGNKIYFTEQYEIKTYSIENILDNNIVEQTIYDGKEYESLITSGIYNGIGIENITISDNGTIYFSFLTKLPKTRTIYKYILNKMEQPMKIYEHSEMIYNLVCNNETLYFSDSTHVYRINKNTAEYICDYVPYKYPINAIKWREQSFIIFDNKLYYNLNDFQKYIVCS